MAAEAEDEEVPLESLCFVAGQQTKNNGIGGPSSATAELQRRQYDLCKKMQTLSESCLNELVTCSFIVAMVT